MAIKLPVRNYFTFDELCRRWQCEANDLRHAIIVGEVKPSIKLNGEFPCLGWDIDASGDFSASDFYGGDGSFHLLHIRPRDWYYLQDPIQISAFDCEFHLAADRRDAEKGEIPFDYWIRLPSIMLMADVEQMCVFQMSEISRYEAKFGSNPALPFEESALRGTERNTLLLIIAALAEKAGIQPSHHNAASTIEGLIELLGVRVTAQTVREKLDMIPAVVARREVVLRKRKSTGV